MKRILLAFSVLFSGTLSALAQSENLLATFEVGNNNKEFKIVLGSTDGPTSYKVDFGDGTLVAGATDKARKRFNKFVSFR